MRGSAQTLHELSQFQSGLERRKKTLEENLAECKKDLDAVTRTKVIMENDNGLLAQAPFDKLPATRQ